eukprot:gene10066-7036_t
MRDEVYTHEYFSLLECGKYFVYLPRHHVYCAVLLMLRACGSVHRPSLCYYCYLIYLLTFTFFCSLTRDAAMPSLSRPLYASSSSFLWRQSRVETPYTVPLVKYSRMPISLVENSIYFYVMMVHYCVLINNNNNKKVSNACTPCVSWCTGCIERSGMSSGALKSITSLVILLLPYSLPLSMCVYCELHAFVFSLSLSRGAVGFFLTNYPSSLFSPQKHCDYTSRIQEKQQLLEKQGTNVEYRRGFICSRTELAKGYSITHWKNFNEQKRTKAKGLPVLIAYLSFPALLCFEGLSFQHEPMRPNRPEVRVVTRFKPLSEDEKAHNKNKKISPMCVVFDQQNIEVLDRMHQSGAPPSLEFAKNRPRRGSINEMAKNFTMDEGPHYKMRGMIPRMVEELFRRLKSIHRSERTWDVSVSIFEIYKEDILDLLAPAPTSFNNPQKYRIREDLVDGKGIYIEALERPPVKSAEEVMTLIRYAANKRKTAVTNINETSSRSHSLVIIYLDQVDYTADLGEGQHITSRLNLVDLAGSEKVYKTLADGERLQEAKQINLSLTLLGNVIYKLTDGKSGYVPYRDSKLTRILQESLGGNSITTLVCHCSIAMYNREETLSTLRFAQRAKRVRNKPQINKDLSAKELKLQLVAAEQKIDTLEKKLRVKSELMAKQKDSREEKFLELQALIDSLMREIEQLKDELALKEEELAHEKARAELYKREAAELAAELEKERRRNDKEKKIMADALKNAQEDNERLLEQLEALTQELAKPPQDYTPRKERSAEKDPGDHHTPSPARSPKRPISAPFDRTAGSTVEDQVRRASFMLGRPLTAGEEHARGTSPLTQNFITDENGNIIGQYGNREGRVVDGQDTADRSGFGRGAEGEVVDRQGRPLRGQEDHTGMAISHTPTERVGQVCPACGHHLPGTVMVDEETNTDDIGFLLAAMENGEYGEVMGPNAGRTAKKDNLRQLGNDEVGRALQAAGQFMGAIVGDGKGDIYRGYEESKGDDDDDDAFVAGEDGLVDGDARRKKKGKLFANGEGMGEGSGVRPMPTNEVLGAVALLEQVLHVIADAIDNDQFHVPPPPQGQERTEEEEAAANAAQEELKEALKMSERVLAAWRESGGDLKPADLAEQEKKKEVPMRLLSQEEREDFKAHEKELAAAELDAIQRRLQRQAVAEELAAADKNNLLGRQELRAACAVEEQQAKEILKDLFEKLHATAEEATQTVGEDGRPRTANPNQEKLLQQCLDRLAKALEEHMAKNGEHLADNMQRDLRRDNNSDANAHADALGKGIENMTQKIAEHCDEVLGNAVDRNEPVDASTFEKMAADVKKQSDKDIAGMYQRAARDAAKDQKASMDKLHAEVKKDNDELRRNLNDIVDAEVQKMAMEMQAASEDGDMELSKDQIRSLCYGVSEKAKEEVNRLAADHISAVEESLAKLEKGNEQAMKQEMKEREERMKKNAAQEINQMMAKMQVLAMHEQMAPQGDSAPLTARQLEQLTEQLKLVSNPDIPLTNEFTTPYKEKDRDDWIESEQPKMIEPIMNMSDKILHASDECVAEATDKYDNLAHESIADIGKSYKTNLDGDAQQLPKEILTAQEQEMKTLTPAEAKEVSKALAELSHELQDINSESKKHMHAEMVQLADKEMKGAKEAHHALSEREAEHFAAVLSTASSAYWGDLLSDDAGTLETFMQKLKNLSADEIEDVAKAHRDLSEEQQKALAQQLQRQYGREQQKAHQNLVDAVEERIDALAAKLHALHSEEEEKHRLEDGAEGNAGKAAEDPTKLTHEKIDEMCDKMKREALDNISATEKNERDYAAAELTQMRARQNHLAAQEEEAMRERLEKIAQKDLARMEDRLGNLLVQSMSAAEQRPRGSEITFTPEKLKALGDNINVLIAHESEDPYSNSLRSILSRELKEATREEGDRFFVEGMEVASAQHDKTLKGTEAQCAKDVRVLAQRKVAMGEEDLEEVPEKLSILVGHEVGDSLSPEQTKLVQNSMNELANAIQALFEEERRDLDKKLEALTSQENQQATDRHTSLSRADLKNLSGQLSKRLEDNFQEIIDKQEPITAQTVEKVSSKLQEMCNDDIAALCEKHGRLSEAETKELEEKITALCAQEDGLERAKVEKMVDNEINSMCRELSSTSLNTADPLTAEQVEIVRGKMKEMAAEEIGRHYEKKSTMTAEEATGLASRLGDLHARSNVQLMERLQGYANESVQKMTAQVAHSLITATNEGFSDNAMSPSTGALLTSTSGQYGQSPAKPSVARAVVNELVSEEVANAMKEAQLNAQEYAIIAEQVMELNPKNKRELAEHIRRSAKTAQEQERATEPPTSTAMVVYTKPVSRVQYEHLSRQIEKLADLQSPRTSVKSVPPRNIERLSTRIQELSRPEFTLLCKRLDVQVLDQTPREQIQQSTIDAIRALVNYIGSVNSNDRDSLTSAAIQGNVDPVSLNRALRILNEAAGYHVTATEEAATGTDLLPLHSYQSTNIGLTSTEGQPASLHQWSQRMQTLCEKLEDAAMEEVEPTPVKPILAIEDRQPQLLLRDYSEGRTDATGYPLNFMTPVMTHRAECVELVDRTAANSEEACVLSDMNALQAAETVIRRNLALPPDQADAEEVSAAATTVERVIQRAVARHPVKEKLSAMESLESTPNAANLTAEELQERLLLELEEKLHARDGEDVMPIFFDTLVQKYLEQPEDVQDALEVIHATDNSPERFNSKSKTPSRIEASEEQYRKAGSVSPSRKEMLSSMQVVADAVASVLDQQRSQILVAYEEEDSRSPSHTERQLTSREANRILWATQNLGAAMQSEEVSPSQNTERSDQFPRQIQCASVAMRALVNEAMVESPRGIQGTMAEDAEGKQQFHSTEDEDPVWRMLKREDVREAVRAFDSQAKNDGHEGDVPVIFKGNTVEKATVPVVHALKLPSSFSERSQHMRGGLSVLDYGLNNVEGKPRIAVGKPRENDLFCEPLPTARDPNKKVLTRYGYAKSTRDCGTMTDFHGKGQQPLSVIHGNAVDDAPIRDTVHEMLTVMGVSPEEMAMIEDQPDPMGAALQRLRREVMVIKKAEEPCLRREIEMRHRELACIYDTMQEMIDVVKRSSLDAAERNDVFALRITRAAKGNVVDKLRDKVAVNSSDVSTSTSDSDSREGKGRGPSRHKMITPAPIPTKAMLADGTFDERMNRKPEPVELQTLPRLEALVHAPSAVKSSENAITNTPHLNKAEKAPKEVAEAMRETTAWMDELQERYYELMKRYLESFGRAERLDELLDKSRNERDDSKQELDALKLVLDSMRRENNQMKEVLEEMNIDIETYMSSLEHQKRVNERLAEQSQNFKNQAAMLATSAEQQEFLDMAQVELDIRGEEMEEIEQNLDEVQNFYDPDLIAKKRQHLGKGIRSIGTFCQKILSMCQSRPRFNTANLESQRLNLLQGTAELYNRYEWAKEELNEQLERQRAGVSR